MCVEETCPKAATGGVIVGAIGNAFLVTIISLILLIVSFVDMLISNGLSICALER
jgi:hypothetical protein